MRVGRIKLSEPLFDEIKKGNNEYLKTLFSVFTPIHIEYRPHYYDVVYTGICSEFKDVTEGESPPFYSAVITTDSFKNQLIKFENEKGQ